MNNKSTVWFQKTLTIAIFSCILFFSFRCQPRKEEIPPVEEFDAGGKMIIYQMLPRLFGNQDTLGVPFGTIEENGCGKFNHISSGALQELKALGISHLWLTGVLEHASLTAYPDNNILSSDADVVKGRAGSVLAIKDYYDVDPDLAVEVEKRMEEFQHLIDRSHQANLSVLIDFIPNHVAREYQSDKRSSTLKGLGDGDDTSKAFDPENNFYYIPEKSFVTPAGYNPLGALSHPTEDHQFEEQPAKASGNNFYLPTPTKEDWFDVVKLNYGVDLQGQEHFDPIPSTWKKMKNILLYWSDKGVDGFVCHQVDLIPIAFWTWVIPVVKSQYPEILFIGNLIGHELMNEIVEAGFDKVQVPSLYEALVAAQKTRLVAGIDQAKKTLKIDDHKLIHFMERHDLPRLASPFFKSNMWDGSESMLVSSMIDKGGIMLYHGQELGEVGKGMTGYSDDNGTTSIYDYTAIPALQQWVNEGAFNEEKLALEQKQIRMFYAEMLMLVKNNPAVMYGDYFDLTEFNVKKGNITDSVHVFLRAYKDERLMIVNGFNNANQVARIQIPKNIAKKIGLNSENTYLARDLIWREVETVVGEDWTIEIPIRPSTGLVLKIK